MRHAIASLAATALALATGCGGDRNFTAQELVDEVNAEGASLELGPELQTIEGDTRTYAVEFAHPTEDRFESHGGGSLTIAETAEAGMTEYQRCEDAASLVCYRAANAVLFFEDGASAGDLARVDAAIRALAEP